MTAMLAVVLLVAGNPTADVHSLKAALTPEQAGKLAEKLAERKPFSESEEAHSQEGRQTMGMFFSSIEYKLLKGNPVYGYWNAAGFQWSGNRIAWDGVTSKGASCRGITRRAWNTAFAYVAQKHGLVVDETAPMRIRGACVWAVMEASEKEPVVGVVMEMRLDSPTGSFRWRYSRGNPTIEGAVGASIELPILLAPKVNQRGWPRDEQR